jgi:hypothetical protein
VADPYASAPPQRWDTERFVREREREREIRVAPAPVAPVLDRPAYDPGYSPRRAPAYEQERYYEEDRYGPRGSTERRYFEETDYYNDPRARGGQMVPYVREPERPARIDPMPPRPGILRRQSSLDTFDRRPARRYDDYDDPYRRAPPPVTRELIPVRAPSPSRRYPPTRAYEDRYYDDVRVQDPDRYGDDGFREYREREWVRTRRNDSPSPEDRERDRDRHTVIGEQILEEKMRETVIEEEKPYPRRGKTRMPKRLVHTKVLFDLGYPYYEEVSLSY